MGLRDLDDARNRAPRIPSGLQLDDRGNEKLFAEEVPVLLILGKIKMLLYGSNGGRRPGVLGSRSYTDQGWTVNENTDHPWVSPGRQMRDLRMGSTGLVRFLRQTPRACCGAPGVGEYNFNLTSKCGEPGAYSCEDPSSHWSWDGIHLTEASYGHIARGWLYGPFADPPILGHRQQQT
ncbi:hypothetical protein PR202_ga24162 [Eleusine coracana subsp. coracana]|uniref:GDSL esterase/lipase n=1 Tax=Eleusine coracana subsp. coracana TaxID=191504 RepID=A0AAV5D643_ELECO|nr:hypothetical protein PR202_ga24162 [Eleusine coracana subsp. coracana]